MTEFGLSDGDFAQNPPPCFSGLLFFLEGNFYAGDLFLQEETGTLRNFLKWLRFLRQGDKQ